MTKNDIEKIQDIIEGMKKLEQEYCKRFCKLNDGDAVEERQEYSETFTHGINAVWCELWKAYKRGEFSKA